MPKLTIHTHKIDIATLKCSCGKTAKQVRKEEGNDNNSN